MKAMTRHFGAVALAVGVALSSVGVANAGSSVKQDVVHAEEDAIVWQDDIGCISDEDIGSALTFFYKYRGIDPANIAGVEEATAHLYEVMRARFENVGTLYISEVRQDESGKQFFSVLGYDAAAEAGKKPSFACLTPINS